MPGKQHGRPWRPSLAQLCLAVAFVVGGLEDNFALMSCAGLALLASAFIDLYAWRK